MSKSHLSLREEVDVTSFCGPSPRAGCDDEDEEAERGRDAESKLRLHSEAVWKCGDFPAGYLLLPLPNASTAAGAQDAARCRSGGYMIADYQRFAFCSIYLDPHSLYLIMIIACWLRVFFFFWGRGAVTYFFIFFLLFRLLLRQSIHFSTVIHRQSYKLRITCLHLHWRICCVFIHPFIHHYIHSYAHPFIQPSVMPFFYSCIQPIIHHSFIWLSLPSLLK